MSGCAPKVAQVLRGRRRIERPRKMESLTEPTVQLSQCLGLGPLLDPLCDRLQAERVRQPDNRVDESSARRVVANAVDEVLRDLHAADREAAQVAERGVT